MIRIMWFHDKNNKQEAYKTIPVKPKNIVNVVSLAICMIYITWRMKSRS